MASNEIVCKPHKIKNLAKSVTKAVEELSKKISGAYPEMPNTRWIAMRLLDGDERVVSAMQNSEFVIA